MSFFLYKYKRKKNRSSLSACFLMAALMLGGFSDTALARTDTSITDTGFYFDTVVTVRLDGTDDETILKEAFEKMADYESMLSRTREGSDVWEINHNSGNPVEVHEETAALLALALEYGELSDGAFDITIAPYIDLWDFQNNSGTLPSEEALAKAGAHTGLSNVHLDGTTVTLDDPDTAIDLGGIAKGYIADRIKEFLLEKGVTSAFINLGGNVLTIGTKPDGQPWNIGIRDPFRTASDIITIVKADGQSIVTSGTYERFFEKDGVIYHHILDPQTGCPIRNGLKSVTILSDTSADGDALSTSCFVLGLERGMELIETLDQIEAMFITEDEEIHYSSGFPQTED